MRWRIIHTLNSPIDVDVRSKVTGYLALGVGFNYDSSGKLDSVEHEVEATTGHEAMDISQKELLELFEIFTYQRGVAVFPRQTNFSQIGGAPPATGPSGGGRLSISSTSFVANPIRLPDEKRLVGADPRLAAWLSFANVSRTALASPDGGVVAQGLRGYYLVLEDMDRASRRWPCLIVKVEHARSFVSHPRIERENVLKTLKTEGIPIACDSKGKEFAQYDPHDVTHTAFVKKWGARARAMVETELNRRLL